MTDKNRMLQIFTIPSGFSEKRNVIIHP